MWHSRTPSNCSSIFQDSGAGLQGQFDVVDKDDSGQGPQRCKLKGMAGFSMAFVELKEIMRDGVGWRRFRFVIFCLFEGGGVVDGEVYSRCGELEPF